MILDINSIEVERRDIGGVLLLEVALAEEPEQGRILIFSRDLRPQPVDINLDLQRHCLSNEDGVVVYGAVTGHAWRGDLIDMTFESEAARVLGIDNSVTLRLRGSPAKIKEAHQALDEVLLI